MHICIGSCAINKITIKCRYLYLDMKTCWMNYMVQGCFPRLI